MRTLGQRDRRTLGAAVKLTIFSVVSLLVTGGLAVIMGHLGLGAESNYQAVFTSASSLKKGDDVRIAGVTVGRVTKVSHYEDSEALVSFDVDSDVDLTHATTAEVRYLDLVGNRYLSLGPGNTVTSTPMEPGDRIPVGQTTPALDLTVLFNGFKPLFQALQPDQVNDLTMNLIQVFQGEGGTVQSLLAHTASLTTTLADHDRLIGEVIDNLDTTLDTVDSRHQQLDELITQLQRWLAALAHDRGTIGDAVTSIAQLTHVVGGFLQQGRPLLKSDIGQLRRLGTLLNQPKNKAQIQEIFDRLPESMTDQTRTGTYGSWYNYYICGFGGRITLPVIDQIPILKKLASQLLNISFHSNALRCTNHGGSSDPLKAGG